MQTVKSYASALGTKPGAQEPPPSIHLRRLPGPADSEEGSGASALAKKDVRMVAIRPIANAASVDVATTHLVELIQQGVPPKPKLIDRLILRVNGKEMTSDQRGRMLKAAKTRSDSPPRRGPVLVAPETTFKKGPKNGEVESTITFKFDSKSKDASFQLEVPPKTEGKHQKTPKLVSITGPQALHPTFYDHIAHLDLNERGTGHMRSSHHPNAFPRFWSFEKIGRAVKAVLTENSGEQFPPDSSGRITLTAMFEGLPITVIYGVKKPVDEKRVITAFVSTQISAGELENQQVDKAYEILRSLENDELAALVKTHGCEHHIWNTLALTEVVAKAEPDGGVSEADADRIQALKQLLCIGEQRHPVHREMIDRLQEQWAPAQG